jgi:hypothetical protein
MPSLFPSSSALNAIFGKSKPVEESSEKKKKPSSTSQFQIWSVTEDAERKASELSTAAAKEYQKASSIAQAKAGNIELYSAKYCEFISLRMGVVLRDQVTDRWMLTVDRRCGMYLFADTLLLSDLHSCCRDFVTPSP